MKHATMTKLAAALCACLMAAVLGGCASGAATQATEEQQANRAYMSQVNETMVELDESLDQFVDAVSRGDIVNMRTQADNAYKVLDKLANIEAPEALDDIRSSYIEGTDKLREALDDYIDLYTEASAADEVNASDFNARIAAIQSLYDAGVSALQAGDETAAGDSPEEEAAEAE